MRRILHRRCCLASLLALTLLVGGRAAMSLGGAVVISQQDKQFKPGAISVETGQPVVIVNDDGSTVHHAYVESATFDFDSGDQNPGTRTTIVFPGKGDFQVLCGIHPKMRLDVHVR